VQTLRDAFTEGENENVNFPAALVGQEVPHHARAPLRVIAHADPEASDQACQRLSRAIVHDPPSTRAPFVGTHLIRRYTSDNRILHGLFPCSMHMPRITAPITIGQPNNGLHQNAFSYRLYRSPEGEVLIAVFEA
jgi:hypothetical protein